MHTLLSRVAPQSTCRCFSCGRPASEGVTSRAATAASKRRLRIANSVTALYSSVFCAATLADARAKDKRRAEWEEKIAAVKTQVSELKDEEHRILESLSSHKRRPIGQYFGRRVSHNLPPVRHYSTAPSLARENDQPRRDTLPDGRISLEVYNEFLANSSAAIENELMDDVKEQNDSLTAADYIPGWASSDVLRVQAIHKLAVKQLAIRLLLRPSVAHNYAGTNMNYEADFELPRLNIHGLFRELNTIRRRIRHLKESKYARISDLVEDLPLSRLRTAQKKRDELDAELEQDVSLCYHHQMSLEELLVRLSGNLMRSPVPDRPKAFKTMVMGFSKMRQNDVVQLILKSILPNYFTINFSLIIAILTFFRKSKDLKNFDLFLQMLRGEGYPVNMGKSYFKTKQVNGIDVTVPPIENYNTVIYSTLITAALRFDQPERADAWHHVARNTGFMDNFATVYAYLKFYTIRNDWEKGMNVLRRALAFMVSADHRNQTRVERLVLLMVELCDACGQSRVSDALISAFVQSGLDRKARERQLDCTTSVDPGRWNSIPESEGVDRSELPVFAKCSIFTSIIGSQADELLETAGPSVSKQQQQLMKGQFSQGVLSSAFAAAPVQTQPPNQAELGSASKYYYVKKPALDEGRQDEIKSLTAEVARLKEVVSKLNASNPSQHGVV
ncbi:hypothetical protein PHISP_00629 [Aspergillus sp. HF37]|nr:hypothetical protein PHISP_00629 [Aspergillus sp. HF37]